MTQYHDPRAVLDYSEFQEVDPALEKSGYLSGKIIARPGSIDADHSGPNPRQTPLPPAERAQYESVRARLDRALQVCGVVPSAPQEHQTPLTYEASLLRALENHTSRPLKFSPQTPPADVIQSCTRRNVVGDALGEPARQGRLAEVKIVDQAGREILEFVGSKRVWMDPLKRPAEIGPFIIDDQPQRF